jgi:hypothetical protein
VYIFGAQPPVVGKIAVSRVGEPGRHFPHGYLRLDGFGPGARFRIREKRHRADFSRPVADLAVLLENGKDVSIKCGGGISRNPQAEPRYQPAHSHMRLKAVSHRSGHILHAEAEGPMVG